MPSKFTSRKFILALVGVAAAGLAAVFPAAAPAIMAAQAPIAAFILGEAAIDHARVKNDGISSLVQSANGLVPGPLIPPFVDGAGSLSEQHFEADAEQHYATPADFLPNGGQVISPPAWRDKAREQLTKTQT